MLIKSTWYKAHGRVNAVTTVGLGRLIKTLVQSHHHFKSFSSQAFSRVSERISISNSSLKPIHTHTIRTVDLETGHG